MYIYINIYIYIISKREARRSQSEASETSNKIIPRSNKRARGEIKDRSTTILVNQASTSTITEEPMTVDTNCLSPGANNNNQNIDKLVQKLKLN